MHLEARIFGILRAIHYENRFMLHWVILENLAHIFKHMVHCLEHWNVAFCFVCQQKPAYSGCFLFVVEESALRCVAAVNYQRIRMQLAQSQLPFILFILTQHFYSKLLIMCFLVKCVNCHTAFQELQCTGHSMGSKPILPWIH